MIPASPWPFDRIVEVNMRWNGLPVTLSPFVTDPEEHVVRRSWGERLCTWPWRPHVAERVEVVQVPSNRVLKVGDQLIMHPAAWAALRSCASQVNIKMFIEDCRS